MAKLMIDPNYVTASIRRVYWEGSPGVPVYEGHEITANKIVRYLNAMAEEKRNAYFCPGCGLFLKRIDLSYHRQKAIVMENDKVRYDWQPYPVNVFSCWACDYELDDDDVDNDQLEILGVV